MGDADIVIGKARVIVEAMASGRAAYVYDHNGGDGWVTPERYELLEADNFGGQAEPVAADRARLRADLRAVPAGHGRRQPPARGREPQREQARAGARPALRAARARGRAAGRRAAARARAARPGAGRRRPAGELAGDRSPAGPGSARRTARAELEVAQARMLEPGRDGARGARARAVRCAASAACASVSRSHARSTGRGGCFDERARPARRPRARRARRPARRAADRPRLPDRGRCDRRPRPRAERRISSASRDEPSATVLEDGAVICAGAIVFAGARICAGAIVGDQAHMRERATLGPGVRARPRQRARRRRGHRCAGPNPDQRLADHRAPWSRTTSSSGPAW